MSEINTPKSPRSQTSTMFSVIVPVYNEKENIRELYERLTKVLTELTKTYELLFVNDGSNDETPWILEDLANLDQHLKPIHLSRNFGHQAAVSAGLSRAQGQAVIIMDGDLQDPPEVLPDFVTAWRSGAEVVYAIRRHRKENWLKRLSYFGFYRLLNAISDLRIPLDSGDFCLMDQKVVRTINRLPERTRFIRGLRTYVGYRQVGVEYERLARAGGKPKYTLRALVRLAVDGLVSFSGYPLRLATYLGFLAAFVGLGLAIWAFADAMTNQTAPRGWASTIIVVIFMGSAQLISLGIIGEYLRLIFLETKQRPGYIILNDLNQESESQRGHEDSC